MEYRAFNRYPMMPVTSEGRRRTSWLERRRAPKVDWRAEADPDDLREYDAFGPWIDQVTSPEQMPPRFRDHWAEFEPARLVLKFPRPVDRADLRPGQDLYAAVLAIFDDRISLVRLAAPGGSVSRQDVPVGDVVAVSSMANLLVGRWTLLLRDGSRLELAHPTLSRHRIEAATDLVRAVVVGASSADAETAREPVEIGDIALRNALSALRPRCHHPVPVHFEPRNTLRRDADRRWVLTSALMLVDTPEELVIVHGGAPRRPWRGPGYAWTTTFVPYAGLTAHALEEPVTPRGLHRLVLTAGDQVVEVPCAARPDGALAAIERHCPVAVPRRG